MLEKGRFSIALLVALAPGPAFAQLAGSSGIAGVVRDTSGAVLPGVTVEASSPALIEQTRTVVTDGQGRFSIVELRPGPYTVAFSLPGFSTIRRGGIELGPTRCAAGPDTPPRRTRRPSVGPTTGSSRSTPTSA